MSSHLYAVLEWKLSNMATRDIFCVVTLSLGLRGMR